MAFTEEIRDGAEVFGDDGRKIGRVGQVFVLQGTDDPTWIAVQTGLFGMQESFVPVAGATTRGDELIVAYDKAFVKDAPRIGGSDDLTVEQEAELYRYYGIDPPRLSPGANGDASPAQGSDDRQHDEHGAHDAGAADAAQAEGAQGEGVRRPRLRRRIVTEMQTVRVPVQREEIVVEGEGIAPDDDGRPR